MTWSDIPFRPSQKALRQFAVGCAVFFPAVGASQYFLHNRHGLGIALGAAGVGLCLAGLIRPALLRWLFVGWMVLAFPIGWAVSQCMLLLMYFLVLTPVALFFRMRGRDLLRRKPAPNESTYWMAKSQPRDVRSYFQQY